jgi:hypothetical protein
MFFGKIRYCAEPGGAVNGSLITMRNGRWRWRFRRFGGLGGGGFGFGCCMDLASSNGAGAYRSPEISAPAGVSRTTAQNAIRVGSREHAAAK